MKRNYILVTLVVLLIVGAVYVTRFGDDVGLSPGKSYRCPSENTVEVKGYDSYTGVESDSVQKFSVGGKYSLKDCLIKLKNGIKSGGKLSEIALKISTQAVDNCNKKMAEKSGWKCLGNCGKSFGVNMKCVAGKPNVGAKLKKVTGGFLCIPETISVLAIGKQNRICSERL